MERKNENAIKTIALMGVVRKIWDFWFYRSLRHHTHKLRAVVALFLPSVCRINFYRRNRRVLYICNGLVFIRRLAHLHFWSLVLVAILCGDIMIMRQKSHSYICISMPFRHAYWKIHIRFSVRHHTIHISKLAHSHGNSMEKMPFFSDFTAKKKKKFGFRTSAALAQHVAVETTQSQSLFREMSRGIGNFHFESNAEYVHDVAVIINILWDAIIIIIIIMMRNRYWAERFFLHAIFHFCCDFYSLIQRGNWRQHLPSFKIYSFARKLKKGEDKNVSSIQR